MKGLLQMVPASSQAGMLLTAVTFTPARIWTTNLVEIGYPDGLVLWSAIMLVIAFALWAVLVGLGGSRAGVTYTLFWLMMGVGAAGSLVEEVPSGTWGVLVILVIVALLAYRLRDFRAFVLVTQWAVVFALLMPMGIAISNRWGVGDPDVETPARIAISDFPERPDVVVVVFDGHGSPATLERMYGVVAAEYEEAFDDAGLTTALTMRSNYTLTHLSLASFFEMGYPVLAGVREGSAEWAHLLNTIRGDNQLVDSLRSQGYRSVFVESGWSGVQCGSRADVCARRVWPDDATSVAARRSLFRDLYPAFISEGLATGAVDTIRWFHEELSALTSNEEPDFVFAHLMLPHPPLFVDENCEYRTAPELGGLTLAWPGIQREQLEARRAAYVEATRCVKSVVAKLAAILDRGAILIAFADHGPDSLGQLFQEPGMWDDEELEERFGVLFVTNDEKCGLSEIQTVVNVGRRLIGCLGNESIDLLPDRYFVSAARAVQGRRARPIVEVDLEPVGAVGSPELRS